MAESTRDYAAEVKEARQKMALLQEQQKRSCDHKPGQKGKIIPLHEANISFKGKNDMPETTVYCTSCGEIFESSAYTADELQSGIYMFSSVLNQIKLNAKLSDSDKDQVEEAFAALDTLKGISKYYNDMVDKMSKGNGNNNRRSGSGKGHFGMNPGMMGRKF